jgi:hypothetical protein
MQQHLIDNLKKKLCEEVSRIQSYNTSGTPCFKIVRSTRELEVLENDLHSRYKSSVNVLLYLVQHSRPDIENVW